MDERTKEEVRQVAAAMREYQRRCDEILSLLGDKRSLSQHEREQVAALYKSLKDELREVSKTGTLAGRRGPRTRVEDAFFDPAVRKAAHSALRAATNSNPISSNWRVQVWEAGSEFSYYLDQLERWTQER